MTRTDSRTHWTRAATALHDADGSRATARDPFLQELIEEFMEARIEPGSRIIDLGCGDGQTNLRLARASDSTVGIDFIAAYVERARKEAKKGGILNVLFRNGDVLDVRPVVEEFGLFDVAISIRCLINLNGWNNQSLALRQIASALRPGGLYLAAEGWLEGLAEVNACRESLGLAPIRPVEHNCFILRSKFESEISKYFEIADYYSLGTYIFYSRVFHPLCVFPQLPKHDDRINRAAAKLQREGPFNAGMDRFDYVGVYVLRRRTDPSA